MSRNDNWDTILPLVSSPITFFLFIHNIIPPSKLPLSIFLITPFRAGLYDFLPSFFVFVYGFRFIMAQVCFASNLGPRKNVQRSRRGLIELLIFQMRTIYFFLLHRNLDTTLWEGCDIAKCIFFIVWYGLLFCDAEQRIWCHNSQICIIEQYNPVYTTQCNSIYK